MAAAGSRRVSTVTRWKKSEKNVLLSPPRAAIYHQYVVFPIPTRPGAGREGCGNHLCGSRQIGCTEHALIVKALFASRRRAPDRAHMLRRRCARLRFVSPSAACRVTSPGLLTPDVGRLDDRPPLFNL